MAVRASKRRERRRDLAGHPQTAIQVKLCKEYLKDYNATAAAVRAGYSQRSARNSAPTLIRRFTPYLSTLQQEKTRQVIARHVLDQDDILRSWSAAASYDPLEFVERIKVGQGKKTRTIERQKSIFDLTPAQRQCIESITAKADGTVGYVLRSRDKATDNYAKHLGMLHDKLIQEHRHRHLHATIDLSHVSTNELAALETQVMKLVGPQAAKLLGLATDVPGEVYDAEVVEDDDDE